MAQRRCTSPAGALGRGRSRRPAARRVPGSSPGRLPASRAGRPRRTPGRRGRGRGRSRPARVRRRRPAGCRGSGPRGAGRSGRRPGRAGSRAGARAHRAPAEPAPAAPGDGGRAWSRRRTGRRRAGRPSGRRAREHRWCRGDNQRRAGFDGLEQQRPELLIQREHGRGVHGGPALERGRLVGQAGGVGTDLQHRAPPVGHPAAQDDRHAPARDRRAELELPPLGQSVQHAW